MPSDVRLEIDGDAWNHWSNITLTERIDSIAQVEFTSIFDPERKEFRDAFRPFSYREITLFIDGEIRFIGTMMSVEPNVTASTSEISVSAYARCGVLNDCTPGPDQFPTEFLNQKLDKIAKQLCEPLGVDVSLGEATGSLVDLSTGGAILDIDAAQTEAGTPFKKVQLKPGQKILSLLIELAKQRNLIIRSDSEGGLLFYSASTNEGDIVAEFTENRPVVSVAPAFNVQEYFSELTGISKTKGGKTGSKFTVQNEALESDLDTYRPFVYELNDTDPADVPAAVDSRMGRMFASSVSYNIGLATARDESGFHFRPDRHVSLHYPKAMVYQKTAMLIREVKTTFQPDSETAMLNVILPGTLSGVYKPAKMPWDE